MVEQLKPADLPLAGDAEPADEIVNLETRARQLAGILNASVGQSTRLSVLKGLGNYERALEEVYRTFRASDSLYLSSAAEWMLDNYYVLQRSLYQIKENFPSAYEKQLPRIFLADGMESLRVYHLIREYLLLENCLLDVDRLRRFIQVYQETTALSMGELWSLPIMLRLVLVQVLTRALRHTAGFPDAMEEAAIELPAGLHADQVVANTFISLRAIDAEDWKVFFESISIVEFLMRNDPSGHYPRMDFETRDRYRKKIETVAKQSRTAETEVARNVLQLAQSEVDQTLPHRAQDDLPTQAGVQAKNPWIKPTLTVKAHVGYYLFGNGLARLEKRLEMAPGLARRIGRWFSRRAAFVYIGAILAVTFLFYILIEALAVQWGAGILLRLVIGGLVIVPFLTFATNLVNWTAMRFVKPRVLPKMDYTGGIPEEFQTLVVIPALLANRQEVVSLKNQLELHYLRNEDQHVYFALVTDYADAPQEVMPEDGPVVEFARQKIMELNQKYGQKDHQPFIFLHRKRLYNSSEGVWMGWERKRGKLHELNQMILGDTDTTFSVSAGNVKVLSATKYVITLDADTILPRDAARRLVATISHPLNRAVFDPLTGRVIDGYTVLQPRTEIELPSANHSFFSQVFAGDSGLDLYTLAASDVYMDLFGEGIYVGKGIYDVSSFERSLRDRVPENALLSHDLFEGIQGRAGLVSDVVVIEDYPPNYLVHAMRLHRWVRGDWQLFPWLLPFIPQPGGQWVPNPFSALDLWKIIDNLRRSLISPFTAALMVSGWTWLPGPVWFWTLVGMLTLAAPLLGNGLDALLQIFRQPGSRQPFFTFRDLFWRWLLAVAFLPYESLLALTAIGITLVRVVLTHRRLLNWTTAASAARKYGRNLTFQISWRQMLGAFVLGLLTSVAVLAFRQEALPVALPFLVLWVFSPEIAFQVSQPLQDKNPSLPDEERQELRRLSVTTWIFFENFVGPEDHWLPPDHFQEAPLGVVAHRTSPTNIGLYLVANQAAYEMGYIGTLDFIARTRSTFDTLDQMERYRGHFLNWYDTRSLAPLPPRYISTVDSGNMAASLITLSQGFQAVLNRPVVRKERWLGLCDVLSLLVETVETFLKQDHGKSQIDFVKYLEALQRYILQVAEDPSQWQSEVYNVLHKEIKTFDGTLQRFVEENAAELGTERLRQLRIYTRRFKEHLEAMRRDVDLLLPWVWGFSGFSGVMQAASTHAELSAALQELAQLLAIDLKVKDLAEVYAQARQHIAGVQTKLEEAQLPEPDSEIVGQWCDGLAEKLQNTELYARMLQIGLNELEHKSLDYIQEMDFSFLFDEHRKVFHIGYNLSLGQLDNSYYDLLASEARIASLIAIAKRDVPQSHWLHLGRPITRLNGFQALLSWSATMFEYLMPLIFVRNYEGTLLYESAYAAVDYQIRYAQQNGVPWGISESGYYRFDANMNYQYRAFGVPGLGYKRGLEDDLVVTPYASLLALPLRTQAVLENVQQLKKQSMLGLFGLYEAIDFTPSHLGLGKEKEIVRSYMAHHQGMIFLSIVNYLKDNLLVRSFHAAPLIQSVELLLHEQIPYGVELESPHTGDSRIALQDQGRVTAEPWRVPLRTPIPITHVLSNGHYNVLLTNAGGGASSWGSIDLTRWRPDMTLDNYGAWI
ncbi:MAG: hypothetical protein GYA17_05490, partial [Chloroflexi bacterium]|nr:hypothetical protein [Chloroflexota bacterium]